MADAVATLEELSPVLIAKEVAVCGQTLTIHGREDDPYFKHIGSHLPSLEGNGRILSDLPEEPCIIDVGANIGVTSALMGRGFDRKLRDARHVGRWQKSCMTHVSDLARPQREPLVSPAMNDVPIIEPVDEAQAWAAFAARDRAHDGRFVVGVLTTGIYCRPSCAARRPRRENVRFFADGAGARDAGLRACKRCLPDHVAPDEAAIGAVKAMIEAAGGPLPLALLGKRTGYSPSHLQRIFTRSLGLSPAAYGRALRLERARASLESGASVAEAIYEAGYSGPSRFYAEAGALGVSPAAIRLKGEGMIIHYTRADTRFGPLLVAATERGLCHVGFDSGPERLRSDYPRAELVEDRNAPLIVAALAAIEDPALAEQLPVDVPGTAFQQRVWAELRKIPPGETRSYLDIARALGDPKATRAVGGANGRNPVAIIVPCHRVIAANGTLGGYSGGLERKKALLDAERPAARGALL